MRSGMKAFLIIAGVLLLWRSPELLDSIINLAERLLTPPPK